MNTPLPPPPPPSYGAPLPPPSAPMGPGAALAKPGLRIVARFLDGLILAIVVGVIGAVMVSGDERLGFGGMTSEDVPRGKLFAITLVGLVISFVYEAVLTARLGGTPMKRAFGMRVVDATTGAPITMKQSVIRWAVPGVAALLGNIGSAIRFVVSIVSLVFLFTDSRRQTVSDKVAKTVVVVGR